MKNHANLHLCANRAPAGNRYFAQSVHFFSWVFCVLSFAKGMDVIMPYQVGFVSLGCAKNQVNSEQMLHLLDFAGYEITMRVENVDVVIVNTCGFIESAKSEAIENILELAELKKEGKIKKILVAGCLSERYQSQLLEELPEIDGILGCGSYNNIVSAVDDVLADKTPILFDDINAPLEETGRVLTTPGYFAYLKIAEGCDNCCGYCVIPSLRGKYRSREMADIMEEAELLANEGVRELILVAQDTSRYGLDLYGRRKLPELLTELCRIEGFRWIRIHYLYPDEIDDQLIDVIAREKKIVKYLDIPIQHINTKLLQAMNRRGTKEEIQALIKTLRAKIPGLVLRTSLIAGLPGEGEAEFQELYDFLKEYRLERVGVFPFSPEEGTPAASLDGQVDPEEANSRAERLMELQYDIMEEYNRDKLGKIMTVLCEGYDRIAECHFGRTYADSPEVDGKVFFMSGRKIPEGAFVQVQMTDIVDGDLVGELIGEDET